MRKQTLQYGLSICRFLGEKLWKETRRRVRDPAQ